MGFIINNKFHSNSHIQFILPQRSQRLHLIKLLQKQGLGQTTLCFFRAIITCRIQYAISAWGGFIYAEWKHKIDALLTNA
jgi:hypothetical protein